VQLAPERGHAVAHAAEGVEHRLPSRIQRQPAADAVEKCLAEGLFEFVQHLARGRLGHAQLLGGSVQRAEFVDRQQQRDLAHAQAVEQLFGSGSGVGSGAGKIGRHD